MYELWSIAKDFIFVALCYVLPAFFLVIIGMLWV